MKPLDYLFRGMRMDNMQWITGSLVVGWELDLSRSGDTEYPVFYITVDREDEGFQVYPDTIGQWSTFCDMLRGKPVFSGDRVMVKHWNGGLYETYVAQERGAFYLAQNDTLYQGTEALCKIERVIGTIYDTEEML